MSVPLTPERIAALHPLEFDAETGEPYLRLPAPHSHIVLTPSRLSDVPYAVENLNDMRIAANFVGPPYPYLEEHAISWITQCRKACDDALVPGDSSWFNAVPVRAIRDISNSSIKDARLIGDCGLDRDGFLELMDEDERKRLEHENADREVGDPNIVWCFGGTSHTLGLIKCLQPSRLDRRRAPGAGYYDCCCSHYHRTMGHSAHERTQD